MALVFGIRSKDGLRFLGCNPFDEGGEVPLAEGESLFMYRNEDDLVEATKVFDTIYWEDPRPWWKRLLHIND